MRTFLDTVKSLGGGGIWVDLDICCLSGFKDSDIEKEYIFTTELDKDKKEIITNAILSFPANSAFANELISQSKEIIKLETNPQTQLFKWLSIGPLFLTKLVQKYGLEKLAYDYKKISQNRGLIADFFINKRAILDESQIALHFYTESWNLCHLNKNATYNKACIVERLKQKHRLDDLLQKLDFKLSCSQKLSAFLCALKYRVRYDTFIGYLWYKSKIRELLRHPKKIFKAKLNSIKENALDT